METLQETPSQPDVHQNTPGHSVSSGVQQVMGHDGPSDYYDILLMGKTGLGKSTTGNKLLGITAVNECPGASEAEITTWGSEDGKNYFETQDGAVAGSAKCKLLSDQHNIRVLDAPGFADTQLTKQQGLMGSNLQIFRWVLREQKKHDLAFRRVLYFLPARGPPERADGALQEEIKVMYEFLGQEIFKIMVIIATNHKDKKYQTALDEEDIGVTKRVFTAAFERVTGQCLPKSPPILYLPFNETDVLSKIKSAKVIEDEQIKIEQPMEDEELHDTEKTKVDDTTKKNSPGKTLKFQDRCTRCAGKLIYESSPAGKQGIKVVFEDGDEVLWKESKCHPIFIPKFSKITRVIGGIAHTATLGIVLGIGALTGMKTWPGFTNSDEICPVCGMSPGSLGCSVVDRLVDIPMKEGKQCIKISHSIMLDTIILEGDQEMLSNDDPSKYNDILLVGRTGVGKSTTGNKLLETKGSVDDKDHFETGDKDSSESVTKECKLLSNEHNIRVLDTPGWVKAVGPLESPSNIQIFQKIQEKRKEHNLTFRHVLYFLPSRGPLEHVEKDILEEIHIMHRFLGDDIFNKMAIIATNRKNERYQVAFDEEDIMETKKVFSEAFERVTRKRLPKCPPILYLPFTETDILKKIEEKRT